MAKKSDLAGWRKLVTTGHSLLVGMVFTLTGVACVGFGSWVLLVERNVELGIGALGGGVALLFASMIGRFESVKVWGVEAKMRQLNETVDKAEDALEQLRKLTELTSLGMVRLYSGLGRYAEAPNMVELAQLTSSVKSVLFQIGSSEDVIHRALEPWVRTCALVAHTNVREELHALLEPIRLELLHRKQIAMPNEQLTLMPRLRAVEGYLAQEVKRVLECAPSEIPERIESMVADAPELSMTDKVRLSDLAAKAAREVRFLVTNYKFADNDYWNALPYQ